MNLRAFAKKRSVLVAAGGIVLLGLVVWVVKATPNPVMVVVGEEPIYERDINARLRMMRIQSPNATANQAQDQLVRSYTRHQLLKMFGMPITDQMINQERERILKSTSPGSGLEKIVNALGKDSKEFQRDFLVPMLVDRTLYGNYFLQRVPEQLAARKKAEDFHKAYEKDPKAIAGAAKLGFTVTHATVTEAEGLRWDPTPTLRPGVAGPEPASLQMQRPNPLEGKAWFAVLGKMKGGEVGPLRDHGDSWLIYRVVSRNTKGTPSYRLEIVKAPKVNFENWAKSQASKVTVRYK